MFHTLGDNLDVFGMVERGFMLESGGPGQDSNLQTGKAYLGAYLPPCRHKAALPFAYPSIVGSGQLPQLWPMVVTLPGALYTVLRLGIAAASAQPLRFICQVMLDS